MKTQRSGCFSGGCLTLLIGILFGAALTILVLVGWAMVRPVDDSPISNRIMPGGADLEVTMSEAFLNEAVSDELAKRSLEELARIVIDTYPDGKVEATLQGSFSLGAAFSAKPVVVSDVRLGVANGTVDVRIERVGVGPVKIDRDTLPDFALSLFESAEETMEQAISEPILSEGYEVREVQTDEGTLTLGLIRR